MDKLLRRFPIYPRLILCFLSIIIIPYFLIGFLIFSSCTSTWEESFSNFMSYTTNTISESFSANLDPLKILSNQISENTNLITALSNCNTYMSGEDINLDSTKQYIANKKFINKSLYAYCSSDPVIANLQIVTPYDQFGFENTINFSKGGYIKNHTDFLKSPYYVDAINNSQQLICFDTTKNNNVFFRSATSLNSIPDIITLTSAILDTNTSTPLGVIVINIYSSYFYNTMSHSSYLSNSNILLLSHLGPILPLNMNLSGPIITSSDIDFSTCLTTDFGSLKIPTKKETYFLTYRKIPFSDMYISNIIDYKEVLSAPYNILKVIIKIAILLAIICLIIAYFVTHSIISPLNQLKHTMSKLGTDNLDIECAVSAKDEISTLGVHFNQMIHNIKELINRIYIAEINYKNLELGKKNAQLYALQLQINPHFLYNTLDIIRWETINLEQGDGQVSQMIESFSNWLRYNIKSKDLLSLDEELQNALKYIEIINFRHSKKIQIDMDMPSNTSQYLIPKLTLQPILENTLLHGFNGLKQNKKISIHGYFSTNSLDIIISDNGIGITADTYELLINQLLCSPTLLNSDSINSSIGLRNIHERLKLYFGDLYGLTILPPDNNGLTIKISIPK